MTRAAPWSWSEPAVDELRVELRSLDEVRLAQARIRRFAAGRGFDRRAQWEITIAASEAGANMVRHAGGGRLRLASIGLPRPGLRLEARDFGPGIADLDQALADHVSEGSDRRLVLRPRSGGGLGLGLGAVRRLMDSFRWQNLDDGGLLVAEKYLSRA